MIEKLSAWELKDVVHQVTTAYADCGDDKDGVVKRLLNFRCNTPVGSADLLEVLKPIGNYNNFCPSDVAQVLTREFGDKYMFYVARESSVCIYVRPINYYQYTNLEEVVKVGKELLADEIGLDGLDIRFWWD